MDTYLLMIYVTLEQEAAITQLYTHKGWQFRKKGSYDVSLLKDNNSVEAETTSNNAVDQITQNNEADQKTSNNEADLITVNNDEDQKTSNNDADHTTVNNNADQTAGKIDEYHKTGNNDASPVEIHTDNTGDIKTESIHDVKLLGDTCNPPSPKVKENDEEVTKLKSDKVDFVIIKNEGSLENDNERKANRRGHVIAKETNRYGKRKSRKCKSTGKQAQQYRNNLRDKKVENETNEERKTETMETVSRRYSRTRFAAEFIEMNIRNKRNSSVPAEVIGRPGKKMKKKENTTNHKKKDFKKAKAPKEIKSEINKGKRSVEINEFKAMDDTENTFNANAVDVDGKTESMIVNNSVELKDKPKKVKKSKQKQHSYKEKISERKNKTMLNCSSDLKRKDTKIKQKNTQLNKDEIMLIKNEDAEREGNSGGDFDHESEGKEQERRLRNSKREPILPASVGTIVNKILEINKRENSKKADSLTCPYCDRIFFNQGPFIKHVEKHAKNAFDCPECGKKFTNHRNLNAHRFNRSRETVFPCDICNLKANTACLLRIHKKKEHPPEIIFQCHLCAKIIKTKSYLNVHLKETHNIDDGHLECKLCGKKLHRPKLFAKHMKEHEEHRNYFEWECSICEKKFKSKLHLRSHTRIHRDRTFLCDHCGKGFVTKTKLHAHERTHTGVKPFECPLCHYKSTQNGNLRLHMKVHEKEEERKKSGESVRFKKSEGHQQAKPDERCSYMSNYDQNIKPENSSVETVPEDNGLVRKADSDTAQESSTSSDENSQLYPTMSDTNKMLDYYKYLCDPQLASTLARAGYSELDIREVNCMDSDFVSRLQQSVQTQAGYDINKSALKSEQMSYPELKIPDPSKQKHVVNEVPSLSIQQVGVLSMASVSGEPKRLSSTAEASLVPADNIAMYTDSNQHVYTDPATVVSVFPIQEHKACSVLKPNTPHITVYSGPQNRTVFSESPPVQYSNSNQVPPVQYSNSNQMPPTYSHLSVYGSSTRPVYHEHDEPVYAETLGSIDYSETIQSVYDSSRLLYARTNKQETSGETNWKNQNVDENVDNPETNRLGILDPGKSIQLELSKSLYSVPRQAPPFHDIGPVTESSELTFLDQSRRVYPSSSQSHGYIHYTASASSLVAYAESERFTPVEQRTVEPSTYSETIYQEPSAPSNSITNPVQFSRTNLSVDEDVAKSYHNNIMASKADFSSESNTMYLGAKSLHEVFANSPVQDLPYAEQGSPADFPDHRHSAYTDLRRASFTDVHQHEEMQ